jgi:tRNA wybutosine-synthesizing protein 2
MGEESKEIEPGGLRVVLVVPKQYVKTVKTALEQHGKLDRTTRIVPEADAEMGNLSQGKMRIPTTISYQLVLDSETEDPHHGDIESLKSGLLQDLDLHQLFQDISLSYQTPTSTYRAPIQEKPLRKAIHEALATLPSTILSDLSLTTSALADSFPLGYSIYPPLLLLPHNAFTSPPWALLLTTHPPPSSTLKPLWTHLAALMGTSHIAINSPIPLMQQTSGVDDENILRSPINITPLHGSFGPLPTPQTLSSPTQSDFETALWVTTTQNGIHQTWAPLFTMFSRGNIREKTRLLHLPSTSSSSHSSSPSSSHDEGEEKEAVVDMYSGIGYFSFSYRASGKKPVFCFELNPWSVEGLRRGVGLNGWTCKIMTDTTDTLSESLVSNSSSRLDQRAHSLARMDGADQGVDFFIYPISNARALSILNASSPYMPPIRHVNLGLLPRSRDSWRDAVGLVNKNRGGWIRAHENVGVEEMEERKEEVERVLQRYLDDEERKARAKVEHVERVKMYAPGVVHCVFDVWIEGENGK